MNTKKRRIKVPETILGASAEDAEDLREDEDDEKEPAQEFPQQQEEHHGLGEKSAQKVMTDLYRAVSDAWDSEFVKVLDLPKMLLRQTKNEQICHDRSVVMVYLQSTPESVANGQHKKLFMAAAKDEIKFGLNWLNPADKDEVCSKWVFEGARIQGLDFGSAATERPEPNMITVEVAFNNLKIDGISI